MVSKKKLKKVTEVGFIPGIYNYCDRWCEKCNQKSHCMSYAMGKKIEERGGFNFDEEITREDDNVWARLKDVFESTYEVLHELAEERGIDIEDIYASENIDREFWGEDYENSEQKGDAGDLVVEASDIIRICLIYEDMADKCLEKIFELLDDREENESEDVSGNRMEETLDVINWYLDLIQAKMRRALYGVHRGHKGRDNKEDCNGSAKVALIAIDRSVEAWKTMMICYPGYVRDISHILVVLKQLSSDIENEFKDSRAFVRPGFE